MKFNLQRFAEESESDSELQAEEKEPIPEELGGLDEDIAREAMAEWEEFKQNDAPESSEDAVDKDTVSRADYQAKVEEAEKLKAQLAEYQRRVQPSPQPLPQPQIKITPEISAKINEAIKAEAMNMSGLSEDDVASLDYADDDDPRIAQWSQAKSLAQSNVLGAIRQAQIAQQYQAQQFMAAQMAAVNSYNEFAQREFKEPDFQNIQQYATNEFFERQSPAEQKIIANSYLRVERQIASPAEMLVVKNYYEQAKASYREGRGKIKPARTSKQQATSMPRVDELGGSAGKGEITVAELERMLETTDFDKIPEVYQKKLLGIN